MTYTKIARCGAVATLETDVYEQLVTEGYEVLIIIPRKASKLAQHGSDPYVIARKYLGNKRPHYTSIGVARYMLGLAKGDRRQADHINHDPLDNRRCNVRIATQVENSRNKRPRAGGSSKYKGVSWRKREKRWRAAITIDSKRVTLGYFRHEVDAARAYDAAAREHFKDFAWLNFPAKNAARQLL